MHFNRTSQIKVRGFIGLGFYALYIGVVFIVGMWILLPGAIVLPHYFPALGKYDWSLLFPAFLFLFLCLSYFLSCFYFVILTPDGITVQWFGLTIRTIPAAKLQLFCAVGHEREDVLCLSCNSISEVAEKQERRLLKGSLKKHDVPWRKRQPDWQESFTREYLNNLRISPLRLFMEHHTVMLKMQPELQYMIQHMYPSLPYKNYTVASAYYVPEIGYSKIDSTVCIPYWPLYHRIKLQPDGIHILRRKVWQIFIPSEQIQTVVRVDVFKGYHRSFPHHLPLMLISCLSEKELAEQVHGDLNGMLDKALPDRQSLLAMAAATRIALKWTRKNKHFCVTYYTKENIEKIRALYPHVQFNEISANWLRDT